MAMTKPTYISIIPMPVIFIRRILIRLMRKNPKSIKIVDVWLWVVCGDWMIYQVGTKYRKHHRWDERKMHYSTVDIRWPPIFVVMVPKINRFKPELCSSMKLQLRAKSGKYHWVHWHSNISSAQLDCCPAQFRWFCDTYCPSSQPTKI